MNHHASIGFYDAPAFYPDFIIWIKEKKRQRIIFVDPKGIHHFGPNHPKMKLHDRLREIQPRLNNPNVALDAFIISTTPMEALREQGWAQSAEEWSAGHVLFQQSPNYLQSIFSAAG